MPATRVPPTALPPRAEIERRETGYVGHFLDAVLDSLAPSTALAIGVGAATWLATGEAAFAALPAAMTASLLPAAALALLRRLDAHDHARAYDSPRVQAALREVEAAAEGTVASRRGTVWIVRDPDGSVRAMNGREYGRLKRDLTRAGLPLDEVVLMRAEVRLTRTRAGRPIAPSRDLPCRVPLDPVSGRMARAVASLVARRAPNAPGTARPEPYAASRFLRGGSGFPPPAAGRRAPARPAYAASRFLAGGTGFPGPERDRGADEPPGFGLAR